VAVGVLFAVALALRAVPAANASPYGGFVAAGQYVDPVPHNVITQSYRVCQGLDELTARIDNLYRKPLHKTIASNGVMQSETVCFRDTVTGHEIAGITRELCVDISHPDLGRPVWACDGSVIFFMGNRGARDADGRFRKGAWSGHKYVMNADYTDQRPLYIRFGGDGVPTNRAAGIYGKFNILDPADARCAYYAATDALWRVTLQPGLADARADRLTTFATPRVRFIQAIGDGRKLLIQDANSGIDKATGKPEYMPELHLVDLNKSPTQPGFYEHHPFDYGLPEVRDDKSNVVHKAGNNYQFHSLTFGHLPNTIVFNYGPMTDVGEPLGWILDISRGLGGTPTHGAVSGGSGVNPWGQYESHGKGVGGSTLGLYFGGTIALGPRQSVGGWGVWVRDYASTNMPRFILTGPGGHIAGGNCRNPRLWAAHMSAGWRAKVKESDGLVWGDPVEATGALLCYTYSDLRGSVRFDRATRRALAWSGMENNQWRPYHAIPRPLLSPDGTKVWFHSAMLMPYDDYVGIYVVTTRRPAAPRDLRLGPPGQFPALCWQPSPASRETKCYRVYRADGGDGALCEIGCVPAGCTAAQVKSAEEMCPHFSDRTADFRTNYVYAVTAEEWSGLESDETSNTLLVRPGSGLPWIGKEGGARRGWDKAPPPTVSGFGAAPESDEPGQFRLNWERSAAGDLRYYNVYFSATAKPEAVQARRIVSPPATATTYLDWSAPTNALRVWYAITAVDRQGNESAPSYAECAAVP
jgi:hypothetical protein